MHVLILGSGGREHALAWAVRQNPKCDKLTVAPGNAGIAEIAQTEPLDIESAVKVVEFCQSHQVDLVIIGPEAPLAAGVSDALRDAGLAVFGPSQAAAELEASKAFTKSICDAADIPTAAYCHVTDLQDAHDYIAAQGVPIVIKADGLAAGKGVTVALDLPTAHEAINEMFGGSHGDAGREVVIEEFMDGEEASLFVICDGETALPIGTAQDHKRVGDGDTGPNTGGMGAYSPAPVLGPEVEAIAMDRIIMPTLREMTARGTPFQGILYAGLMIKDGQPRLMEYNVRFGDPECQVIMMRLGAQILDAIVACVNGQLASFKLNWASDHALTLVMAAKGYPSAYQKGSQIKGLDALPASSTAQVFHAGTKREGEAINANGGRVLNITARGQSLREAHDAAYAMIKKIDWPDGFYRSDIGWRALRD